MRDAKIRQVYLHTYFSVRALLALGGDLVTQSCAANTVLAFMSMHRGRV